MPVVTVTSGYKKPDNYFKQPNGAYPVTLKRVGASGEDGEFVDGATYEHKSALYGLKVKQSWQFQLDNGEIIETGIAIPNNGNISTNSNYYKYASALVGRNPKVGQSFDSAALIGLKALAFIQRDDDDIPRITALSPLEGATVGAVAPVVPEPVAQPTPTPDALPF